MAQKILANASKHSAMSYDHLEKQMKLAEDQIAKLLAKAEHADSTPLKDGLSIPDEIQRRKERLEKEQVEYEQKLATRRAKEGKTGRKPGHKPPVAGPKPRDQ